VMRTGVFDSAKKVKLVGAFVANLGKSMTKGS